MRSQPKLRYNWTNIYLTIYMIVGIVLLISAWTVSGYYIFSLFILMIVTEMLGPKIRAYSRYLYVHDKPDETQILRIGEHLHVVKNLKIRRASNVIQFIDAAGEYNSYKAKNFELLNKEDYPEFFL